MELYKAIWSGIVNGIVNLSPLSSGAHFEIYKKLISDGSEQISALIMMSGFGSLLALVFYFRREYLAMFRKSGRNKLAKLLLISLPVCVAYAALFWLIVRSEFIMAPIFVAAAMLVSSVFVLNYKKYLKLKGREKAMTKKSALIMGLASCFSVLPGFSRIMLSSMAGKVQNIKEGKSLRYSILASAPFLLVVFVCSLFMQGGLEFFSTQFGLVLLANIVSFIVTLFVIRFIMKTEEERVLRIAAWYQVMLALLVLVFELMKM